jgi:plasmid stabilization system protein ParE
VASKSRVKLSANFERNLESIETFWLDGHAPQAFAALIDELLETVIPHLERFPGMGRPFLERAKRSVEAGMGVERLSAKLQALAQDGELREYVMGNYLVLYARLGATVYLLSIKHHRQLSFDFESLWQSKG